MTDPPSTAVGAADSDALGRRAGLRANAINLKDAVIVGMASSGPTASIALTLAAIVSVTNYGGPSAIFIFPPPIFGIAPPYPRPNPWEMGLGAPLTLVRPALNPPLRVLPR